MSTLFSEKPTPQFSTAEYQEQPGSDKCKTCNQPIAGQYYRVNGAVTCAACVESARIMGPQESPGALGRAVLFGIGGAIVGLILYSAVGILTGLTIGYASLAVGYIVGRAVMMGSRGIGGRSYQITAVVLTYAAVSMSAIPFMMSQISKDAKNKGANPAQVEPANPSVETTVTPPGTPEEPPSQVTPLGFGTAIAVLALIGLASPFLELASPISGLIGLVILFVGVRIAWSMTAGNKIEILGPFKA